jgi:hypothetical protein
VSVFFFSLVPPNTPLQVSWFTTAQNDLEILSKILAESPLNDLNPHRRPSIWRWRKRKTRWGGRFDRRCVEEEFEIEKWRYLGTDESTESEEGMGRHTLQHLAGMDPGRPNDPTRRSSLRPTRRMTLQIAKVRWQIGVGDTNKRQCATSK